MCHQRRYQAFGIGKRDDIAGADMLKKPRDLALFGLRVAVQLHDVAKAAWMGRDRIQCHGTWRQCAGSRVEPPA